MLNGSLDAYVAENPTVLSFQALPPCDVEVRPSNLELSNLTDSCNLLYAV